MEMAAGQTENGMEGAMAALMVTVGWSRLTWTVGGGFIGGGGGGVKVEGKAATGLAVVAWI